MVSDGDGGAPDATEAELLGSLIHQNPLVSHFARTGDGSARRISDFLGDRELRRLELHRRLYSRIGVNYQAAISAAAPSGAIVGVALSRADRDFDATEVAALELLRSTAFEHRGIGLRARISPGGADEPSVVCLS